MIDKSALDYLGLDKTSLIDCVHDIAKEYSRHPHITFDSIHQVVTAFAESPYALERYAKSRIVTVNNLLGIHALTGELKDFVRANQGRSDPEFKELLDKNISDFSKYDFGKIARHLNYVSGLIPIFVAQAIIKKTDWFAKFAPAERPGESLLARVLKEAKEDPKLGAELAALILKQAEDDPKFSAKLCDIVNRTMRRSQELWVGVLG